MTDQREGTRVIFLVTRKRSSYGLAERADMRGLVLTMGEGIGNRGNNSQEDVEFIENLP